MKLLSYKITFLLVIMAFVSCHGHFAVDTPREGKYKNVEMDYDKGYDEVWSAALTSLNNANWDIKKADKEKGEIHLQPSYVYTPEFDMLSRIYVEPTNQQIEESFIKPYLRSISYYEKTTEMDPKFTRETLNLKFTPVDDNHTKVKANYQIEPYYSYKVGYIGSVRSNGEFEKGLFSDMHASLYPPMITAPPAPPMPSDLDLNLKVIFFDFDKFEIREDAKPILMENAQIIKDNPDVTFLVESFADVRGTEEYNCRLAQNRADMTRQFLIDQGVEKERIISVGRGETDIYGADKTKEIYQLNRRSRLSHTRELDLSKYFTKSDQ
ncbi:MAG: OmpA family protein [Candidatus Dadabacteria bacterium]|nr:OmpA family protein [Candidatus Dadabacteria bacterium]NIS07866.1 OmpA family protein [Candidatus Dadabacteria bacterium]NIV42886.1 OmpA family protein [Candidatus Dadabacteria bacterium]NIX14856.1 OmpA family protein [Candidatus Dadabacteria bacterium]NIY21470.1 OmpA family protein [Candidatus Dadabacteria bacterium]